MRVIVAGIPRSGKSTIAKHLAESLSVPLRCTDDLISKRGWSAASLEVATWFDDDGPWVVEGVTALRALRKWLERTSAPEPPADVFFWAFQPLKTLTPEQQTMAKGLFTVYREIESNLRQRRILIRHYDSALDPLPKLTA